MTKGQTEEAIDRPPEAPRVERQLKEAVADGTPQPKVPVELDPPQDEVATGR